MVHVSKDGDDSDERTETVIKNNDVSIKKATCSGLY